MGKMHSDDSLNKKKVKKLIFAFLRRKRSGKFHISPEVNEFEILCSLPSPHSSPVSIYRNTPVKIKNYYLSESTVNIMSKIEAGTPDLTLNTDTTNNTEVPSKEDADFAFSAVFDSSPWGFENQKAELLQRSGSLRKSRSMGAIKDKSRPFESSPTRNEPVKPEHSPTEATKSPDSASEPLSNDGLDNEELLQAEYNKLFQIGRELGYDDDEVRRWVDIVLQHSLPDPKIGSEMNSEVIETEVNCNNARVPEFTQRDVVVKEIERHYLQDVFGEDTISARQLLVDNRYTPDETAAPSGQHGIYIHGNSDIASHATLKAYGHEPASSSSSSAASPSFRLAAPKTEHSIFADICGGDDRSAPSDADPLWFRADMDSSELQDSPETVTQTQDTGDREKELKPKTNTVDSNGLIPLLLPLRHNKASSTLHKRTRNAPTAASVTNSSVPRKLHNVGHSSSFNHSDGLRTFSDLAYKEDNNLAQATGKPVPLDRTRKEQLSEATATLANLADCRASTDSCSVYTYSSLIDSLNEKQSEAAHRSGIASETSTSYPDSPTLGYAHLSTPSTTLQDIYIPPSSQFMPRYVPSWSPSANDKMKMPHKNVGSERSKASPRDVTLPSPCSTFSESSFSSRCRESPPSTKWDEEMWYANEKLQALRRETGTEIIRRKDTDPALRWRNHPNHNREWDSANLRCTNCLGFCNICRAPCCVHFDVVHTMRGYNRLPEEKRETAKVLKKIDQWCPEGIDIPSFLQCTECNRRVCPDCCGVCPIFPCHDRICKECKVDPWAPCDRVHEDQTRKYLKTLSARDRVQYFQH